MLRLHIEQQPTRIGLNITDPFLEIRTTPPRLEIDTRPAIVEIQSISGHFEFDFTPTRASYGLKTNLEFMFDYAERGRQAVLEGIGKRAQDGDRMAAVYNKDNAFAELAKEAMRPPDVEVVWDPLAKPDITYIPGELHFNPRPGQLNIQTERGRVDTQLRRGQVDITVDQYASIRFWTTQTDVDMIV